MITQEELQRLLHYNPETGVFTWVMTINPNKVKAGQSAGYANDRGYIKIQIDRKTYAAHRLVWFLFHGEFPSEIDHINGNRSDNRIENLRAATRSQNCGARHKKRGAFFCREKKKWQSSITINRKRIHLGFHDTEDAARATYLYHAKLYRGEFVGTL